VRGSEITTKGGDKENSRLKYQINRQLWENERILKGGKTLRFKMRGGREKSVVSSVKGRREENEVQNWSF